MLHDALRLQDIPDEELTLEEDLLERSEAVMHHEIAIVQKEMHDQFQKHTIEWEAWDQQQVRLGYNAQQVYDHVTKQLLKLRKEFKRFLEEQKTKFLIDKEIRDMNIRTFAQSYGHS